MKILVVDDNPINRLLPLAWLRRESCEAVESADGHDALEKARSGAFDVVLLDLSMPGLSGREVCRALRALPGGERMRIVAYTAHATADSFAGLCALGFDDVLIKPVSREALMRTLRHGREDVGGAA
ncbi:MAG: response regulator [Thauera sp.]|nr:response regulator [Thauera sp.]